MLDTALEGFPMDAVQAVFADLWQPCQQGASSRAFQLLNLGEEAALCQISKAKYERKSLIFSSFCDH